MTDSVTPVVLAAGKGTRMQSETPKVLHSCFGEPMLTHVLRSLSRASTGTPRVVLGSGRGEVRSRIEKDFREVVQEEQFGTGHAVRTALESSSMEDGGSLLVTCGDIPGIRPGTFDALVEAYRASEADLMLLTTRLDDPEGYGRVKKEDSGAVSAIVEEADASPKEKKIDRINTGVMIGRTSVYRNYLTDLDADNEQGELYLTDLVELLNDDGRPVDHYEVEDSWEVTGINTRRDLVTFEEEGYRRRARSLLDEGVTVRSPDSVRIGPWVTVEEDVELEGSVTVQGESHLGTGVTVRGDTFIVDSEVGSGSFVDRSTIKSSRIGSDVTVGPYTHVRPDCEVGDGVRLGNFVELKKTQVGTHSKIPHLSYVGNAEIGCEVNIGAGTIFCNYDGENKYRTTIRDGAFVGSNVEIVAPVTIGENVTLAAGSTITEDVPDESLGVGRSRQENIEEWE